MGRGGAWPLPLTATATLGAVLTAVGRDWIARTASVWLTRDLRTTGTYASTELVDFVEGVLEEGGGEGVVCT